MTEYKGYNIKGDGTFGMVGIYPVGPGSVPKDLRGAFTTSVTAMRAIDAHVAKNEKVNEVVPVEVVDEMDKGVTDGEAASTS